MSQNTTASAQPAGQARTVAAVDRGTLDIKALILLAILLAAGFILNMFVGKAIGGLTGGMIQPEFIISAFCLTILAVRPNLGQALVIGLISAAVIQLTTSSPFIDFAAEGVAAMVMAAIVNATAGKDSAKYVPVAGTFVTTALSGVIFMVIKMVLSGAGAVMPLLTGMLPVVLLTAVFNAILVGALYVPVKKVLKLND